MAQNSLVGELEESARELSRSLTRESSDQEIMEQLNAMLNGLLPPRFRSMPGAITDREDRISSEFLAVIYDTEKFDGSSATVPANAAAVAFAGGSSLNQDVLQKAYKSIAGVKRLKKDEPARTASGFMPSNVTLGVILGIDSADPVEEIGEELDRLNRTDSSRVWPDFTAVLDRGCVHFAVQFPGEGLSSDFLPPSQGDFLIVPAYIHLFARPGGKWAIFRLWWYLFAHLWTWTGDILRDSSSLTNVMPKDGLTICAYQFNLSRQLVALQEEEYFTSRFAGSTPVRIEGPGAIMRSHLRFLPWQDGGAIQLSGKLPLEGLMIFLGTQPGTAIRTTTGQISSVLPITLNDFRSMVARLQRQSNFRITVEKQPTWIASKVNDEGTSTPFYARLHLGILKLRDQSIPLEADRRRFDDNYEVVLNALESARTAAKEIGDAMREHTSKISAGEIVSWQGQSIRIDENIDRLLRRAIESFLNSSVRAIKDGLQPVLTDLGVDFGFLFKQRHAYEQGIEKLTKTDPALAAYLEGTRQVWSETLVTARNDLHGAWVLRRVAYSVNNSNRKVELTEPEVKGVVVSRFASEMLDRVCCFVEELVAYALSKQLPNFIWLTELPNTQRNPLAPERFRLALRGGGSKQWMPTLSNSPFDRT